MSTRQDVFDFLKQHPNTLLEDVVKEISNAKETTVRRYFFEFQKMDPKSTVQKKKRPTSKSKKSVAKNTTAARKTSKKTIREQVFDFMNESPDASLSDLAAQFPKAQKTTLGNYRRLWLKESDTPQVAISKNLRKKILDYLDDNPGSNINDLKKVFPEVANKLITVFRSWKSTQKGLADSLKLSEVKDTLTEKKDELKEKSHNWLEKQKETIARQKEIIEKQQTKIEALKAMKKPKLVDLLKEFLIKKIFNR